MIKPLVRDTKVVFGPCRMSYVHLLEKYAPDNDSSDGKYSVSVLIPKSEKETIKAIEQAIEAAKNSAITTKWHGKEPKNLQMPLRDGDERDDEIYNGHFFINAKSKTRPGVVDKNRQPIMDEEEVYSGMWGLISVTFFGYDANGNKGISCGLNNVMKFKDDERLGGRSSADSDFENVPLGSDEDEL